MAITASGVGSGLDIDGLVSRLMEAERLPLERRLVRRERDVTSDITGLGSLKSSLATFRASLASALSSTTYQQKSAVSSNISKVGAATTSATAEGVYNITVQNLSGQHSVAVRHQFASLAETVGTGTLTFTFGTTSYTPDASSPVNNLNDTYDGFVAKAGVASKVVTINSGNNTLAGVRDAINQADIGVAASVVSDGSGYRLLLTSENSGSANSIQISVSDDDANNTDASGLSRLAFNSSVGAANVFQTTAATDAAFTVNGLAVLSETNISEDVIDGLTLTLREPFTEAESITVSDNKEGVINAVQTMVNGYNDFFSNYQRLTAYDPTSGIAGVLQGDFATRSIASQLRNSLTMAADGLTGTYSSLSDIGVAFAADGSLALDKAKLGSAIDDSIEGVGGVLSRIGRSAPGSGLAVATVPSDLVVGDYDVAVSSLATSGKISANIASASFPITIDASKDEFQLTVDGTASGTITLSNQAYASLAAVAAELQTKINLDDTLRSANKGVTVTVSGDNIEIRSNSIGSSSTVAVANVGADTTTVALGLITATTTNGTDLVGTINGVAGTAEGNQLMGAVGSASEGLVIDVASTAGGKIKVSDGVLHLLDNLLNQMLGSDNPLDSRISTLNERVDGISADRVVMERRLDAIEQRYRRQFNALDILLSKVNSTGSFVTQQLANIPIPGQSKK